MLHRNVAAKTPSQASPEKPAAAKVDEALAGAAA